MKTRLLFAVALSIAIGGRAQTSAQTATPPSPDTQYVAVRRDANSCIWERTTPEIAPNGQSIPTVHRYEELASGLNYLGPDGAWLPSVEAVEATSGGAEAVQGQHKVYFPYDIYTGVIQTVTPDGETIQSRPIGLSYFDGTNSVLIAELTNSVGQIVSANEVIYTNAFTDFPADLLVTYRKSGLECDVVFRSQITPPSAYGLSASSLSTRLELLTEFFNTPAPQQEAAAVDPLSGLDDSTLQFGSMTMAQGKAFLIRGQEENRAGGLNVAKTWLPNLSGRTVLVEELPYRQIQPLMKTLPRPPATPAATTASRNSARHRVSLSRLLPPARVAQASTNTMQLAEVRFDKEAGLCWDYTLLTGNITNFTFAGDSTYYLSGSAFLYGTNTFEGNAVIKFATNNPTLLLISGNAAKWLGSAYRPVIFTARDDNTVGQVVSGSTGNPNRHSGTVHINTTSSQTIKISDVRISHVWSGFYINDQSGTTPVVVLTNVHLLGCLQGIFWIGTHSTTLEMNNCLIATNTTFIDDGSQYSAEFNGTHFIFNNCTIANCLVLNNQNSPGTSGLDLVYSTNSLFSSVTGLGDDLEIWSGNYNGFYNSGSIFGNHWVSVTNFPFQTVGGASYYLATNSGCHNAGTTNIDPAVLAGIAMKTTYPPVVYTQTNISSLGTLSPTAPRDTNSSPDLGYHYYPLDYAFGGCDLCSNLTLAAGTCVGWYQLTGAVASAGQPYAISLTNGASLSLNGNVTQPCVFANYATVQEGTTNWTNSGSIGGLMFIGTSTIQAPYVSANFTKWMMNSSTNNFFCDNAAYGSGSFQNCEFYDGNISTYGMQNLTFSNCLFFRDDISFWDPNYALSFDFGNCTFYNGCLAMMRANGQAASYWQVENCAFDGTAFAWSDSYSGNSAYTLFNYNAYNTNNLSWQTYPYPYPPTSNTLEVVGPNDLMGTNYNWQTSWFGNFYLPTNSALIQKGSTNANFLGLYHFTIQTNQVIEGTNIVSIGYHYVATDAFGNPPDVNGDGMPDYLEDANGDGIFDTGDLADWQISPYGLGGPDTLEVFTPLK